jgi:hypothetical protein
MNIARTFGAAAVLVVVATGAPSLAWAGGPTTPTSPSVPAPAASAVDLSGTYTFTVQSGNTTAWTITPCGPGCATVAASNSSAGNAPYSGQAQLAGDRWNMTASRPDALTCDDNTRAQGTTIYSWDAATLAGTAFSRGDPGVCGSTDPSGSLGPISEFTLTKVG